MSDSNKEMIDAVVNDPRFVTFQKRVGEAVQEAVASGATVRDVGHGLLGIGAGLLIADGMTLEEALTAIRTALYAYAQLGRDGASVQ